MLAPERFHFYQHVPPPKKPSLPEQFDRVALNFRDGRYRAPEWVAYGVIPGAIQPARFDCALDASAAPGDARYLPALMQDRRAAGCAT